MLILLFFSILRITWVNAQDLWEFLGVQTRFDDWIRRRIEDCQFRDGIDFLKFEEKSTGGRPTVEYHLNLDAAKHFSMLERNDRGLSP